MVEGAKCRAAQSSRYSLIAAATVRICTGFWGSASIPAMARRAIVQSRVFNDCLTGLAFQGPIAPNRTGALREVLAFRRMLAIWRVTPVKINSHGCDYCTFSCTRGRLQDKYVQMNDLH